MPGNEVVIQVTADTKDAEKGFKGLTKSLGGIGKSMLPITGGLLALGAGAFAAANSMQKAMDDIRVGTGATGTALEGLGDVLRDTLREIPASADDAAAAIANLNTFTGATGETLKGLTAQVLEVSRVLGEDAAANSQAFGQALKQFGIAAGDADAKLDGLFKLTQDYGVGLGEVIGQVNTYGGVLKNAGFTMSQSADLFARLQSEGIAVSRVMPGLNAAFRNWAKEGLNAKDMLTKTIKEIKGAKDSTEALAKATDIFGAEGAQRLVVAIQNGVFALDDLGKQMDGTAGLILKTGDEAQTFGDKMQVLKNNVVLALEPLGVQLIEAFDRLQPMITKIIGVVGGLIERFGNLNPTVQTIVLAFAGVVATLGPVLIILPGLVAGIGLVAGAFAALSISMGPVTLAVIGIAAAIMAGVIIWKNWDLIVRKVKDAFDFISGAYNSKLGWLLPGGPLIKGIQLIRDNWRDAWDGIRNTFETITSTVKAAYTSNLGWILPGGALAKAIVLIKDNWKAAWDGMKSTIETVSKAIMKVINPLIKALEKLVDLIGKAKGFVGGVTGAVSGAAGKVGGFFAGAFAEGGIVPGPIGAPRLAVVHGGEAVVPPGKSFGGGGTNITMNFNGDINGFDDFEDRVGRAMESLIGGLGRGNRIMELIDTDLGKHLKDGR